MIVQNLALKWISQNECNHNNSFSGDSHISITWA